MRTFAACVGMLGIGVAMTLGAGCKKDDQTAQPATASSVAGQYPQGQYPQQYPQGQYPQQYPQGQYPQQYPQTPQPAVTAAPAGGQLAVPGPAALPCSNDSMCMTHKCNTQYGKCAFPCETDFDCIQGAYCFKGPVPACLPKAPGQP
jgi:hypothetical protein